MLHYIVESENLRASWCNHRMNATLSLVLKARTSCRGARAPAQNAGNTWDWLAIYIVVDKQTPLYRCMHNSYRTVEARSTIPRQVDQGLYSEHVRNRFDILFLSPFEDHVVLIYFIDIGKVQALIPLDTLIRKLFLNWLGVEIVLKGHLILDSLSEHESLLRPLTMLALSVFLFWKVIWLLIAAFCLSNLDEINSSLHQLLGFRRYLECRGNQIALNFLPNIVFYVCEIIISFANLPFPFIILMRHL